MPDFLEAYKPERDLLNFEDDTDDEAGGQEDAPADGTWGGIPMESSAIDVPVQNFDWS